jgi:hypothetical protein
MRLQTISPELVERLRLTVPDTQRRAALRGCEFAVYRANLKLRVIEEVLETLREGRIPSEATKSEIRKLVGRLDEEYLTLQEAGAEGRARTEDYLQVFSQARAASAVLCALAPDAFEALTEAIHEAAAVVDEKEELLAAVESVLE